jgi:hypothetical protein
MEGLWYKKLGNALQSSLYVRRPSTSENAQIYLLTPLLLSILSALCVKRRLRMVIRQRRLGVRQAKSLHSLSRALGISAVLPIRAQYDAA